MKVLLVGLGKASWLYAEEDFSKWPITHTHALNYINGVYLAGGCDTNFEIAIAWGNRFCLPVYESIDEIELQVDLVVIAVNHENLLSCLLKSLKKWPLAKILIEKPLVTKVEDIKILTDLNCQEKDRVWINFPRLFQTETHKIKEILKRYQQNNNFDSLRVTGSYTGGYLNTASHLISLLDFLFGELKFTQITSHNTPDISFDFRNGSVSGRIHGKEKGTSTFDLDIVGSGLCITYKNGGSKIIVNDFKEGIYELPASRSDYQVEVYKSLLLQFNFAEKHVSTLQSQMYAMTQLVTMQQELEM